MTLPVSHLERLNGNNTEVELVKVLILGSGGREHALARGILESSKLERLWVARGNAGTSEIATNLQINIEDNDEVAKTARDLEIDLVVVGPEIPLANGIVDTLTRAGVAAFGPTQSAARIESSKSFARRVMQDADVPSPKFEIFTDLGLALTFAETCCYPIVVKADGLAAGKGVIICQTYDDAVNAIRTCMEDKIFGESGITVVVEEFLQGQEVSVFGFTDGRTISPLVAACDYKKIGNGDVGLNTGGMGCFGPPDFWTEELHRIVLDMVFEPVVNQLKKEGSTYKGILYAGLMITSTGIKTLEFNCRFGDPEAQIIVSLVRSDLLEVMKACVEGTLEQVDLRWDTTPHVAVVLASGGYPVNYQTGYPVSGLYADTPNSYVFHAGTKWFSADSSDSVVTDGGRVLTVLGWGSDWDEARKNAYNRVTKIRFENAYYRSDIGAKKLDVEGGMWAPTTTI